MFPLVSHVAARMKQNPGAGARAGARLSSSLTRSSPQVSILRFQSCNDPGGFWLCLTHDPLFNPQQSAHTQTPLLN